MRQHPRVTLGVLLVACLSGNAGDVLEADGEDNSGRGLLAGEPLRLAQPDVPGSSLDVELPPLEPQPLEAASAIRQPGAVRVGVHRRLSEHQGDLVPRLPWVYDARDDSVSASVTVTSHGSRRVRVALRATLPPGGTIRFFHGTAPKLVGMMDRDDFLSSGSGLRWSPSVPGSTIGVELTLPSSDARAETILEIDRVAHDLATMSDEDECRRLFLACTEPWRWRLVADAVARIRFERPDGSYQCSGTLLNDADENSFVPYFITANHCISTQAEAESLEAEWLYRPGSCGLGPPPVARSTSGGADLLVTDFAADSTLLVFKGPDWEGVDEHGRQVPRFGVRFAGWDSRPRDSGVVYGVHHPGDGTKEYLEGFIEGVRDYEACNLNRRSCQHRRAGIRVSFTEGTVLAGSGGSGLFRTDRLIGVASSTDLCTEAWYGSFSEFFPRVRRWLAGEERRNTQDGGGRGQVLVHVESDGETSGERQVPVREGGSSTYSLSIEPRPTRQVKVDLQISGDTDLQASPDVLHFTPENWDHPREVTLSAREDDDREDGSATVAHVLTSLDSAYQHAGPALRVSERDNDLELSATAPPPVEPGELEVTWEPVAGATSYIVEWRTSNQDFADCDVPDDASCPADRTRLVAATDTSTTLNDLEGDTLYFVRVTARLDPSYGYVPASVFSLVTLAPQRPFLRGWRLVVPWQNEGREPPSP